MSFLKKGEFGRGDQATRADALRSERCMVGRELSQVVEEIRHLETMLSRPPAAEPNFRPESGAGIVEFSKEEMQTLSREARIQRIAATFEEAQAETQQVVEAQHAATVAQYAANVTAWRIKLESLQALAQTLRTRLNDIEVEFAPLRD